MTATALRIATCRPLPEPDRDEAPLAAALAAGGFAAKLVAWDDPDADWDAPIPTILRSTWNYPLAVDSFLAWIDRASAAAVLVNPPDVVRDNVHKRYLLALAARGVPVVPTTVVERGQICDLAAIASRSVASISAPGATPGAASISAPGAASISAPGAASISALGAASISALGAASISAPTIVIKPEVGAASLDARRFAPSDPAALAHLAALTARGAALVQPYVASVDSHGERSLVWIDGALSHAVRKLPRFAGDAERADGPLAIADDERAVALAALAPIADRILYGRVDLARDATGQPMVMELELIEPSLYLAYQPDATARLVAGLRRYLEARPRCGVDVARSSPPRM